MALTDSDMVRAAQSGDAWALGLLLRKHEAGMRAVAIAILGYGPDADDVVQDAMVAALWRIGEVRNAGAAGAWLRTIVRNNCRALLRSRRPMSALEVDVPVPGPEEALEKNALRDWVWHAIGELSEADRLVMMLRNFSMITSYEQIAAVCALPVGTVRSRLSHSRRKLAEALQATADAAHPDAGAYAESRRREASDAMAAAMRGDFDKVVSSTWLPEAEVIDGAGRLLETRDAIVAGMDQDLSDGVRQQLLNVVASEDVLIWETKMINPPDKPDHCPPNSVWLHRLRRGRVRKMRLYHPVAALA